MTPRQVRLVQVSWQRVLPIQTTAAELFYGRLFDLRPELRALFRGDITRQGTMLIAALNAVVHSLHELPTMVPLLQRLAERHVGYGVKREHYDTVGEALLWALRQGLAEAADDETMQAWAEAYGALARTMIAAAYRCTAEAAHGSGDAEWQSQAPLAA